MNRILSFALAVAFAGVAVAQDVPSAPDLRWEPVGLDSFRVHTILLSPGPAADGSLDTLYTADRIRPDVSPIGYDDNYDGPHRLPPGGPWTTDLCVDAGGASCIPYTFGRTAQGTLLTGADSGVSGINRSTDAGRTWQRDRSIRHVHCLYGASSAFDHDVFACENLGPIWRSSDGADGTWEPGAPLDPSEPSLHAFSLAEALPGPELPSPRLIAAALGGIATSDDGAQTWTLSSMWQLFRYRVDGGIAGHAVPGHPYGGVLYAGVRDFGLGYPTVYASEDGGATWELRSGGPDMTEFQFNQGTVAVDPAGGVWVGTSRRSGTTLTEGMVLWSGDGARTWTDVGGGLSGTSINALVFGRDGRLYLGTDAGVWRTKGPAFAVAAEGEPAEAKELGVRIWPNPTGGQVTVEVAGLGVRAVRVMVTDALGREVAVVWDGPARNGQRVTVETAGWLAGVYHVRAVTERGEARAALTVVR